MQFDRTLISVRERGAFETLDLSLHVLRRWWFPLLMSFLVLVIPLAIINAWLLDWILSGTDFVVGSRSENAIAGVRYAWTMALLVFLEAPFASGLTTFILGGLVFDERPKLFTARKPLTQLAWLMFTVRGIGVAWILLIWVRGTTFAFSLQEAGILLLVFVVAAVRLSRPFLPEVVILEQLKSTRKRTDGMTLSMRIASLHTSYGGEIVGRGVMMLFVCVMLTISVFGSLLFVSESLLFDGDVGPLILRTTWPIALWTVALLVAVVRFLNYLDIRVRAEGWEVELQMRAEAQRIKRGMG